MTDYETGKRPWRGCRCTKAYPYCSGKLENGEALCINCLWIPDECPANPPGWRPAGVKAAAA